MHTNQDDRSAVVFRTLVCSIFGTPSAAHMVQGLAGFGVWGLGFGGHPHLLLQRSTHCLSPEPQASHAP